MNWEAIGTIAEVVGAIAVVLSLIYVATQIKQNTEASRAHFCDSVSRIADLSYDVPPERQGDGL